MFYFFFLHQSPSTPLFTVFDAITSYIDEVLLINPPANAFVFGYFNWPTYSGRTTRFGELCYKFFISNYLTQMVNISTQINDCDSCSPALLDLFISSEASIYSTMALPPLGNSDNVIVPVSIDFFSESKEDAPFHCTAHDCSHAYWGSCHNHFRNVPWKSLKLVLLLLLIKFLSGFRLQLM